MISFQIIDTETVYRRLLTTPDAEARTAIFQRELVEPFSGLAKVFGNDEMAIFAQWGMTPDAFAEPQRTETAALIEALTNADAWNRARQALEKGSAAFAAYVDQIPLESIIFGLLIADMSNAPQLHGYTGFGGIPGWITTVYGEATAYNLARVEAATVHELHHNVLGALNPQSVNMMETTVGEYMVLEGLAESFAAELYGADKVGPWVTDFDDSNIDKTKAIFQRGLRKRGFAETRRYIFGDPILDLPVNAGYAMGYRVVQAYLARSGKSVVEATLVPAQTIINDSEFFN